MEARAAQQLESLEVAARSAWALAGKETELRDAMRTQQRLKEAAVRAVAIIEAQGSVFRRAIDQKGLQGARDIATRLEAAKESAYLEVLERTKQQAAKASEEEQRVAAQLAAMEAALGLELEAAQLQVNTDEALLQGPARSAFLAKSLAAKVAALRQARNRLPVAHPARASRSAPALPRCSIPASVPSVLTVRCPCSTISPHTGCGEAEGHAKDRRRGRARPRSAGGCLPRGARAYCSLLVPL